VALIPGEAFRISVSNEEGRDIFPALFGSAWFCLVDSAVTNLASTPAAEAFAANTLPAALFLCCFAKRCRFS
jgi:hypothetical protein